MDTQLACLGKVIPDFASMLSTMSASLLLALMTDPQVTLSVLGWALNTILSDIM